MSLQSHRKAFSEGIDVPDLEADLCDMLNFASFELRREVARELIRLWRSEKE